MATDDRPDPLSEAAGTIEPREGESVEVVALKAPAGRLLEAVRELTSGGEVDPDTEDRLLFEAIGSAVSVVAVGMVAIVERLDRLPSKGRVWTAAAFGAGPQGGPPIGGVPIEDG